MANQAGTVQLGGRAYEFGHMETFIAGASIRIREFPDLRAVTDDFGDYRITVPDRARVTPYIETGGGTVIRRPRDGDPFEVESHWNEIDLQTFFTSGKDLVNVNFQTPPDAEFEALKALLGVASGEDGQDLATACPARRR